MDILCNLMKSFLKSKRGRSKVEPHMLGYPVTWDHLAESSFKRTVHGAAAALKTSQYLLYNQLLAVFAAVSVAVFVIGGWSGEQSGGGRVTYMHR